MLLTYLSVFPHNNSGMNWLIFMK